MEQATLKADKQGSARQRKSASLYKPADLR